MHHCSQLCQHKDASKNRPNVCPATRHAAWVPRRPTPSSTAAPRFALARTNCIAPWQPALRACRQPCMPCCSTPCCNNPVVLAIAHVFNHSLHADGHIPHEPISAWLPVLCLVQLPNDRHWGCCGSCCTLFRSVRPHIQQPLVHLHTKQHVAQHSGMSSMTALHVQAPNCECTVASAAAPSSDLSGHIQPCTCTTCLGLHWSSLTVNKHCLLLTILHSLLTHLGRVRVHT